MTRTTIAVMALIAVTLATSTVYANNGVPTSVTDLEIEFAGFETFLTDVSSEINLNMAAIADLQGNQTSHDTRITDLETDVSGFSSQLSALPAVLSKSISDTNDPLCEVAPYPFAFNDWCPNSFVSSFDIPDNDVLETSGVFVSVKGSPLSTCGVNDIDNGTFRVRCSTGPTNGAEIHYIIVN